MGREKNKHGKITLLVRIKLNSISQDEFILVINEEQNYFSLKENIRAKVDQLCDIDHNRLIGNVKRIRMNKRLTLKLNIDV